MKWTLAGKGKRGRPELTWRRSVEKELRDAGWTKRWTADRQHGNALAMTSCAT